MKTVHTRGLDELLKELDDNNVHPSLANYIAQLVSFQTPDVRAELILGDRILIHYKVQSGIPLTPAMLYDLSLNELMTVTTDEGAFITMVKRGNLDENQMTKMIALYGQTAAYLRMRQKIYEACSSK